MQFNYVVYKREFIRCSLLSSALMIACLWYTGCAVIGLSSAAKRQPYRGNIHKTFFYLCITIHHEICSYTSFTIKD